MADESKRGTREVVKEREILREKRAVGDRDLRKRGKGSSMDFGDTVSRSVTAAADSFSGMAAAVARGFQSYSDQITSDNALRIGLDNGFVEGMLTGYATFFEEMAETVYRVLDDVKNSDLGTSSQVDEAYSENIDYDRLAKLIAAEMLRARGDEEAARRVRPPEPTVKREERRYEKSVIRSDEAKTDTL